MVPIFVNETVMNKKVCNQFLNLSWKKSSKVIRYIMMVVGFSMLGYALFSLIVYGFAALGTFISTCIFGGVILFLAFKGYVMQSKMYFMKQSGDWGADTFEKTVYFYEDKLVQKTNKGDISFEYNEIEGFDFDKNICIIRVGGGSLVIQSTGFTTGDFNKFVASMQKMVEKNNLKKPSDKNKKKGNK